MNNLIYVIVPCSELTDEMIEHSIGHMRDTLLHSHSGLSRAVLKFEQPTDLFAAYQNYNHSGILVEIAKPEWCGESTTIEIYTPLVEELKK